MGASPGGGSVEEQRGEERVRKRGRGKRDRGRERQREGERELVRERERENCFSRSAVINLRPFLLVTGQR